MGIVCPQYYLQPNGETTFPQHLEMFKNIITTRVHVDKPRGRNLHLWFLPFFQVGICMLNKACLNWTWYSMYLKPWLKSWPLHPQKISLLTSFHTRLPMRCGLTFHQQILKVDMLEFCYWFCAPLFNCLLLHRTSLAQAYCQIICWHLVHIGALIVRGYSQRNGAHCHHGLCDFLNNRPRAFS